MGGRASAQAQRHGRIRGVRGTEEAVGLGGSPRGRWWHLLASFLWLSLSRLLTQVGASWPFCLTPFLLRLWGPAHVAPSLRILTKSPLLVFSHPRFQL